MRQRKRNDNSLYYKDWTTQKLQIETKTLWEQINIFDCFGVSDLTRLEFYMRELERRGYDIIEQSQISFEKAEI